MDCKIPTLQSSDRRISVGRFTYGNPRLMLWNEEDRIEIGAFCSIADDVAILGGGEHHTDWVTTYPFPAIPSLWPEARTLDGSHTSRGDVSIGHDVWLGSQCMVMSGVTLKSD